MTDNTLSLLVQKPELREQIHFDTLLTQAHQVLDTHAQRSWSDREEHDPGMTLLQSMMYGVSDLAYRHTLPLPDLLTTSSNSGPFSSNFSRAAILRRDPVTEDDYRHAILNLRHESNEGAEYYFHNVRFIPNMGEQAPKYWLEGENYRYTPTDGSAKPASLLGTYTVQLELSTKFNKDEAQAAIKSFLDRQHNLCESISAIEWIDPHPVNIEMALTLMPGRESCAARLMAQIWLLAQACVRPSARRGSVVQVDGAQIDVEEVELWQTHTGIAQLPPKRDYAQPTQIDISGLISQIKSLGGVDKIQRLEFEVPDGGNPNVNVWELTIPAKAYAQLWSDSIAVMLDKIQMSLNGVRIRVSHAAVERELADMAASNTSEQIPVSWSGRFRDPGYRIPVSERLPACYGLHQLSLSDNAQQLQTFLRPFEQELENGAKQLARLPQLLSFDQRAEDSNGTMEESAWVEHLLGYFDTCASESAGSEVERLKARRGLLKQVNQIAAARGTGVSCDHPVTALQRRIAGRLGIDSGLFDKQPDLGHLPFYVIEHSQLLPKTPNPKTLEPVTVRGSSNYGAADDYFEIYVSSQSQFVAGQVVDLLIETELGDAAGILLSQVYNNDSEQILQIDLSEAARFNPHLRENKSALISAINERAVKVQASSVWLKKHAFAVKPLAFYPDNQAVQSFELHAESYPFITFRVGMSIDLGYHTGREATAWSHTGKVLAYDEKTGVVAITIDNAQALDLKRLYWKPNEEQSANLFSLSLSVVFPEALLGETGAERTERAALFERVVREETPAHLTSYTHWMGRDEFKALSHEYQQWATYHESIYTATPYLPSYLILDRLGLGRSPGNFEGIGFMHIKTDADENNVDSKEIFKIG